MQLPSFIGTCYPHKAPVSQVQVCWSVSGLCQSGPSLLFQAGCCSWGAHWDVPAWCLIAASPGWRLCPVQWVQHHHGPPLPWAGCLAVPSERGDAAAQPHKQCQCMGRREDATHKRVMPTPAQMWHSASGTVPWQPGSVSDGCGFPRRGWRAHTSSRHGLPPLLSIPSPSEDKCTLTEICHPFWRETFEIPLVIRRVSRSSWSHSAS